MDGDSSSIYLSAIIILLLLFFAAYFAVCETAFASVSRVRLRLEADRGDRRAKEPYPFFDHFFAILNKKIKKVKKKYQIGVAKYNVMTYIHPIRLKFL